MKLEEVATIQTVLMHAYAHFAFSKETRVKCDRAIAPTTTTWMT